MSGMGADHVDSLDKLFDFPSEWAGKPLVGVAVYVWFKLHNFGFTESCREHKHPLYPSLSFL